MAARRNIGRGLGRGLGRGVGRGLGLGRGQGGGGRGGAGACGGVRKFDGRGPRPASDRPEKKSK